MTGHIDFNAIARATSGASGADLANIINEAALRAVRLGRSAVEQADLEESVETVIAGAQRKNAVLSAKEKEIVSYHEIGHALVAAKQTNSAPVTKITIVPRTSGALGYTMQVDEGNHYLMNKEELENKIATLTGGRAAEEVVFHSITTGASNDIEQATKLARAMLTRYGMSDEFDMVALETVNNQYLGGDTSLACSAQTQREIDQKVVELVKAQHAKAVQILTDNRAKLDELAQYLYQKETITGEEFMEILNREKDESVEPAILESFEKLSEKGVKVVYKDTVYWVGNHKLLKDYQVYLSDILGDMLAQYESDGNSIIYFGRENELISFVAIKDQIKPTSAEAVKVLRGQDIEVCMLTSDGERTASSVADSLGIIRYLSDALPEDKETFIHELQLQGKTVAMVGDGVNDTQALEAADVSIAMGEGKDIAMEASMVTLKTSDLLLLPKAFSLSRQITGLINQNLFWALIYNLIGIPLAAGILYPVYGILLTPTLATVAMALAGISVMLNSLKLKY